jgi:predicted 2-oxoglutarate/Fe(II)-dependent dioxygenase YbiX
VIRHPHYGPEGVFRIPEFMPATFCRELCDAAQSIPAAAAEYITPAGARHDDAVRKTNTIEAPDHMIDAYLNQLDSVRDELAKQFCCDLGEYEQPQVLAYGRGGHFTAHTDTSDEPGLPEYVRNRAMSLILFLNSTSTARCDGTYGGGTLTFFNVSDVGMASRCRVPIIGEPGLLVAFPSDWLHCVTPVQHGRRWTLVTWITRARLH